MLAAGEFTLTARGADLQVRDLSVVADPPPIGGAGRIRSAVAARIGIEAFLVGHTA